MEIGSVIMFLSGCFAIFRAGIIENNYRKALKENKELKIKLGRE